jgi:hypothetical protein
MTTTMTTITGQSRFFGGEEGRRDRLKSRPAGMARTRVVQREIGGKNVVLAAQGSSRMSGRVGVG